MLQVVLLLWSCFSQDCSSRWPSSSVTRHPSPKQLDTLTYARKESRAPRDVISVTGVGASRRTSNREIGHHMIQSHVEESCGHGVRVVAVGTATLTFHRQYCAIDGLSAV